MARGVASTVIVIITVLIAIAGFIYFFPKLQSQGTTGNNPNFNSVSPVQQQGSQYGGRRKKLGNKKSKTMTTSGIYLLLAAVLIGYITSKFA